MDHRGEERPEGLSTFRRIVDFVASAGDFIASICVAGMLCLTAVAVFMRYFFNAPVRISDEATGFMVVAVVMFGAAGTHLFDHNIRMDTLLNAVIPRVRRKFNVLGELAVLIFSACLLFSAWKSVSFSYSFGDISVGYLHMPMWIPLSMMLVGMVLLGLSAVVRLFAFVLEAPRS